MQQQQQPSGGQFQQQQLPQQPAVGVNPVPVNRGGGPPPQAQPGPVINSALVCYLFLQSGIIVKKGFFLQTPNQGLHRLFCDVNSG